MLIKKVFCRKDGSTFQYTIQTSSNKQEWLKDGKAHREDGPAVIFNNGRGDYWFNDKFYGTTDYWSVESWKEYVKVLLQNPNEKV